MIKSFSSPYWAQRFLTDGTCSGVLDTGVDVDEMCFNANLMGVYRVYLGSMSVISGVTADVSNIITAITMSGSALLYRYKVASYSASFTQPGTVNLDTLESYATPTLVLNLGKLSSTSRNVLESLRNAGPVGGLIETNNLDFWGFGLDDPTGLTSGRGGRVSGFQASSGQKKGDSGAGVSITLSYDSPYTMRPVVLSNLSSIVNTI